jgi:predicted dehydrogenase
MPTRSSAWTQPGSLRGDGMRRRRFISSLLAAPLAGQARIPIAFLGANHSHGPAKVQVVQQNPAFELVGICEQDPVHRARYEKAGVRLLAREALLDDRSIQAVVVDSQVPEHAADALAGLAAGKHTHVEKPPAHNLAGLRAQLDLARRKNLLLQTGYMWRHHPGISAALEAARRGWLGEVHFVRGTISTLIAPAQRLELARFAGGQMFELGGHLIDPMVRLLGAPSKVTPVLKKLGSDGLADDTVAIFEFPRALGTIQTASMQAGASRHRSFEIFGTNGSAVVRPLEPATLEIDLSKAAGPYRKGVQSVELPVYRRYEADFVELAEAIRSGHPLPVSPEVELAVQQALLAASGME